MEPQKENQNQDNEKSAELIIKSLEYFNELKEKATRLRNELSEAMLSCSSLFSPQILVELNAMEEVNTQSASLLEEFHNVGLQFEDLGQDGQAVPEQSYEQLMIEIGLLSDPTLPSK